jgi:hypothetical protein
MDFLNKEEPVLAPVTATAPVAAVAAPVARSVAECTRDTRGESPCAVKDCENCN